MKILLTFLSLCLTVSYAFPQNQPIPILDIDKALETPGICKPADYGNPVLMMVR